MILGLHASEAEERARELLKSLGPRRARAITARRELSGGEQQRVAIARAVANEPKVLLRRRADRQSRSADRRARVRAAAAASCAQSGVAALIATHNLDLAARMDRMLRLSDGLLIEEEVIVAKVPELAQPASSGWIRITDTAR